MEVFEAPIVIVDTSTIDDDQVAIYWKSLDAYVQLPYVARLIAQTVDG